MSRTKLLSVGRRASDRAGMVSKRGRCVGVALPSRLAMGLPGRVPVGLRVGLSSALSVGLHLLLVSAALGGNVAHAAIPSLPPLPAYMPPDESALTFNAPYEATPLPRAAFAETPNPFRDDSRDEGIPSRTSAAQTMRPTRPTVQCRLRGQPRPQAATPLGSAPHWRARRCRCRRSRA